MHTPALVSRQVQALCVFEKDVYIEAYCGHRGRIPPKLRRKVCWSASNWRAEYRQYFEPHPIYVLPWPNLEAVPVHCDDREGQRARELAH